MSLSSCPSDVLLIIFELIVRDQDQEGQTSQAPHFDQQHLASKYGIQVNVETKEHKKVKNTLLSLALTCKHTSETAMIMLYRKICLHSATSMVLLLRTLLRAPHLRLHVRSLACSQYMNTFKYERESRDALLSIKWHFNSMSPFERSVFDLAKFKSFFLGIPSRRKDDLNNESDAEEQEEEEGYLLKVPSSKYVVPIIGPSVLASLICLVPNVTSFFFTPPTSDDEDVHRTLRDSFVEASGISTPDGHRLLILPRLSTLTLYSQVATWSALWKCIWIPFWARFPQTGIRRLETLQANMRFGQYFDLVAETSEESEHIRDHHRYVSKTEWSALEELQVLLTGAFGTTWSQLLGLFPKLKAAHISFTVPLTREAEVEASETSTLSDALLQRKETLELLRIGGQNINTYASELGPEKCLTCLHQFTHLRHLDIATLALFRSPEHIKKFSIAKSLPGSLDAIMLREMWSGDDLQAIESGPGNPQRFYSTAIMECLKMIINDNKSLPRLISLGFQEELTTWRLALDLNVLLLFTKGSVLFKAFDQDGELLDLERLLWDTQFKEMYISNPIRRPGPGPSDFFHIDYVSGQVD